MGFDVMPTLNTAGCFLNNDRTHPSAWDSTVLALALGILANQTRTIPLAFCVSCRAGRISCQSRGSCDTSSLRQLTHVWLGQACSKSDRGRCEAPGNVGNGLGVFRIEISISTWSNCSLSLAFSVWSCLILLHSPSPEISVASRPSVSISVSHKMEARDRKRFAIAHNYPVYRPNTYWVVIFSVLHPTLKSRVFILPILPIALVLDQCWIMIYIYILTILMLVPACVCVCVKTFVDIPKHPEHQSSHSIYNMYIYMFSWDAPLIHFWIFFGNTRKMKNGTRKGLWNLMNEHHSGQEHQQFYKTTHTVLMTCFPNALKVGLLTQKQLWFFIFLTRPFYFLGGPKGCGIDVIASRYYCPLKLEFVPGSKASTIIFYDVRFEKTILVIPNAQN